MRKKIVLLDLGNVLFHFQPERRLAALSAVSGLAGTEIAQRLREADLVARLDRGDAGDDDLTTFISALVGRPVSADECWRIWFSVFSPNQALWDWLPTLAQSYRLGILSNNPSRMRALLTARNTCVDAADVFLSGDIGVMKPAPDVYLRVQQRLDAEAQNVTLVDDSERNLHAAAQLGWRTVHYLLDSPKIDENLLKIIEDSFRN